MITLFLYGIGALILYFSIANSNLLHYSYMELEPERCGFESCKVQDYIIPIWNWSFFESTLNTPVISLHYSYMELEQLPSWYCFTNHIWLHYSYMELELCTPFACPVLTPITLFLYGIGAVLRHSYSLSLILLHYSYMELEPNFFSAY